MTLPVFPVLDGVEWEITKRAEFKTNVFEALSGYESRKSFRAYPKTTFKLSVGHLIENKEEQQITALLGFMLQLRGMYSAFLYQDSRDYTVTGQSIGTGNGSQTQFQLIRNYGGFVEPIHNVNGSPNLYLNGTLTTAYTVSGTGLITFTSPPGSGVIITWTGNFYYRVRFMQDGYNFNQMMKDLDECRDIDFIGSVRNIV